MIIHVAANTYTYIIKDQEISNKHEWLSNKILLHQLHAEYHHLRSDLSGEPYAVYYTLAIVVFFTFENIPNGH